MTTKPSDLEAPAAPSEASPLLPSEDLQDELELPWPATFDRGIQILAGPIVDEKVMDGVTRSPRVRAGSLKKGYYTPEAPSALPQTPSTPAWLRKGLVKMKSLDHRFSADNVATLQHTSLDHRRRQQMDAASYRQKILSTKSGVGSDLRASAGALPVDIRELEGSTFSERSKVVVGVDVSKSPGFKREKQLDRQRRKEKKREEMKEETEDQKSSFLQCTFNMANILMGVGMLGLPYVFKSAGWVGGFCVTLSLCLVTWRTSYYIGRELNGDPRPLHLFDNASQKSPHGQHANDPAIVTRMRKPINGFPGIAREALGDAGSIILSSILYFELFSCLSIFFVSLGDHLHLLFPSVSETRHMTTVAGLLIIPSALLRTPKLLSYLSMVGTIATVLVVSAVVLSALIVFVRTAESSGISDLGGDREYVVYSADGLSLALGLVAYCFSGHAVVPSIYQSMRRPQDFEKMIDVTYTVVLVSCLLVAISGYYMFGDDVEDQITVSLGEASANSSIFMTGLTWLMIMTAISKFTLTMFPLALGFEEMLTNVLPSDLAMEMVDSLVKISLIFLSLAVAVFFPSFSFLCSLVGLICAMIVSVIFPTVAHLKLFGPQLSTLEKTIDWVFIIAGSIVALVGTVATM